MQYYCWEEVSHISFDDVVLWGIQIHEGLASINTLGCLGGRIGLEKGEELCKSVPEIYTRIKHTQWLVSPDDYLSITGSWH